MPVSNSSSPIPFWILSNELLGPQHSAETSLCQGLCHIAKSNLPSSSASFGHSFLLYTFFLWPPVLSLFFATSLVPPSQSPLLMLPPLSLTCKHLNPPRAQARISSWFISLPPLLLISSPIALNTVRVLTTPRSLARSFPWTWTGCLKLDIPRTEFWFSSEESPFQLFLP